MVFLSLARSHRSRRKLDRTTRDRGLESETNHRRCTSDPELSLICRWTFPFPHFRTTALIDAFTQRSRVRVQGSTRIRGVRIFYDFLFSYYRISQSHLFLFPHRIRFSSTTCIHFFDFLIWSVLNFEKTSPCSINCNPTYWFSVIKWRRLSLSNVYHTCSVSFWRVQFACSLPFTYIYVSIKSREMSCQNSSLVSWFHENLAHFRTPTYAEITFFTFPLSFTALNKPREVLSCHQCKFISL